VGVQAPVGNLDRSAEHLRPAGLLSVRAGAGARARAPTRG